MPLPRPDLEHLLHLAALDAPALLADDAAMEGLRERLERLAEWAARLPEAEPAAACDPSSPGALALRDDDPRPGLPTEAALAPSAHHDDALFLVPQVLP